MKTIHKWKLQLTDLQSVVMPVGSKILSLQKQNDVACVWAMVDTSYGNELRKIRMYGSGHTLPSNPGEYIGTVMQGDNDELVLHVFIQKD